MIKEEIFLLKSIYALPIYNPDYISTNNGEALGLLISDTLFLDTLLCQLRRAIIDFSKENLQNRKESKKNNFWNRLLLWKNKLN